MLMLTAVAFAALLPQDFGLAPYGPAQRVKINEVRYDPPDPPGSPETAELIELFNPSATRVDVSGFKITIGDAGGTVVHVVPAGTTIPPYGFFVLGGTATPNVALVLPDDSLPNGPAWIELQDHLDHPLDKVGYEGGGGVPAQYEGQPIWGTDTVDSSWSFQRAPDGSDSHNNGRDFLLAPPTPGAANFLLRFAADGTWTMDQLQPGALVPGLLGSNGGAHVVDPVAVGAGPSPQGGFAASVVAANGRANQVQLDVAPVRNGKVEVYLFLDDTPTPTGESESIDVIMGGAGSDPIAIQTVSGHPQPSSENGTIGYAIHVMRDQTGGHVAFENHFAGGYAPNSPRGSGPSVPWRLDLTPQSSGWQRVSIDLDGNQVRYEFGTPGQAHYKSQLAATEAAQVLPVITYTSDLLTGTPRLGLIDAASFHADEVGIDFFGNPTPNTVTTPQIGLGSVPALGTTTTILGEGLPPNGNAFVLAGSRLFAPLSLGSTEVWVNPLVAFSAPTNAFGQLSVPQPIPNATSLNGGKFSFQIAHFDFNLPNPIPLALSKAMELKLGPPSTTAFTLSANPFLPAVPEKIYPVLAGSGLIEIPTWLGFIQGVELAPPIDTSDPWVLGRDILTMTFTNGTAAIFSPRPGISFARVLSNGYGTVDFMVCSGGAPASGACPQAEGQYERIATPPPFDLTLVERQRPGDNDFPNIAADAFRGEVRVSSVTEANDEISSAYLLKGSPLRMMIVGHGHPGQISLGEGMDKRGTQHLLLEEIGRPGTPTDRFIAANKGKIALLYLYGCGVATGQSGMDFLQKLADALSTPSLKVIVMAWDKTVCGTPGKPGSPSQLAVIRGAQLRQAMGR